jgi:hypothetical protein
MNRLSNSAGAQPRHAAGLAATALTVAALCCLAGIAQAKPARCFTTDDGDYSCQFRLTDRDGSFEISAPGKPSYRLTMDESGVAFGFVTLGSKSIPLPGRYMRDKNEPACWVNDSTQTKICAW